MMPVERLTSLDLYHALFISHSEYDCAVSERDAQPPLGASQPVSRNPHGHIVTTDITLDQIHARHIPICDWISVVPELPSVAGAGAMEPVKPKIVELHGNEVEELFPLN
jgi:hypothetical protein